MDFLSMEIAGAAGLILTGIASGFLLWKKRTAKGLPVLERQTAESEPLGNRLTAQRDGWIQRLSAVLRFGRAIDETVFAELEEALITADLGVKTTQSLLEKVRRRTQRTDLNDATILKGILQEEIAAILTAATAQAPDLEWSKAKPLVLAIVGVNGVGKTTTLGKLALRYAGAGKKVLVGACDTFRAAAVEQLKVWCGRSGVEVISQHDAAPSAVAFDAASAAKARGVDLLIVDTAGRQHTKVNLMEELKKTLRSLGKPIEGAPHEIWLVLDATTGQTALEQARTFHRDLNGLSGIILTKLDGTAKGGIVVSLVAELGIPIRFIGVGEKIGDLRPFDAKSFVEALFSV